MILSFNVLTALYNVLNVAPITSAISGNIIIGVPSATSLNEDIELIMIVNAANYLQSGKMQVKVHVPNTSNKQHNLQRFSTLINLISTYLEDVTTTTDKGTFHFQISSDDGITDDHRDGMAYYTLTLDFQTI